MTAAVATQQSQGLTDRAADRHYIDHYLKHVKSAELPPAPADGAELEYACVCYTSVEGHISRAQVQAAADETPLVAAAAALEEFTPSSAAESVFECSSLQRRRQLIL